MNLSLGQVTKQMAIIIMLSCTIASCKQTTQEGGGQVQQDVQEVADSNIVHRLPSLHLVDTARSGNNIYVWDINRTASDSLGIIRDDLEGKFADNSITVKVIKNGALLFSKTFLKKDFRGRLDETFYSQSILDGCRFLRVHEGMVTFSLAVSYPESDMSRPFLLNIGPDGSYQILADDDLEQDYEPEPVAN